MKVAIWIIAVCELARVLQNMVQIIEIARGGKSRDNAYSEFVKSLKMSDKQFVERILNEFKEVEE